MVEGPGFWYESTAIGAAARQKCIPERKEKAMAAGLDHDRKAPGVYVTELSAFPQSVVGADTAVPIFIGYTETAKDPSTGKPLYRQAVRISSMADYCSCFGGGYPARGL